MKNMNREITSTYSKLGVPKGTKNTKVWAIINTNHIAKCHNFDAIIK